MLVYRKQSIHMQELFEMLQYLLATYSTDLIAGCFNYDILNGSQNKCLDLFRDHVQMVNKPTYTSGSLIDQVYIKTTLTEEFFTNLLVENIYFSDYDVVGIEIQKDYVDFHINLKNMLSPGKKQEF